MAKRHGIPTVGAHGAGEVHLSRGERRRLKRRARRRARAQGLPGVRALQGEKAGVNRTYGRTAADVYGANTLLQRAVTQQLKGAHQSGLKGGYLRQVLAELRSIKGGSVASIPAQLYDARQTRNDDLASIQSKIADARAGIQQDAASNYASMVDSAKTQARSYLKAQASKKDQAAGDKSDAARAVKNALGTAQVGYAGMLKQGKVPKSPSTDWWKAFTLSVASKAEGADYTDAAKAVAILRKKIGMRQAKQLLNPF